MKMVIVQKVVFTKLSQVVQVGEKTVDCNPNFRLFLVTRNPEPQVSFAELTIDFHVLTLSNKCPASVLLPQRLLI